MQSARNDLDFAAKPGSDRLHQVSHTGLFLPAYMVYRQMLALLDQADDCFSGVLNVDKGAFSWPVP